MALALSLCACASPGGPRSQLPAMTPELPDNLREDTGTEPDFRRPTIIDSPDTKSPEEAQDAIRKLERARDAHGDATRQTIEHR